MLDHHLQPEFNKSTDREQPSHSRFVPILILVLILATNALFIAYIFLHANIPKLTTLNFPANQQADICQIKYPNNNPYLYIDLQQTNPIYRCVGQCPTNYNQFTIYDSQNRQLISSFPQEKLNMKLGGVCWSQQKGEVLRERNLQGQILNKQNILMDIKSVYLTIAISFCLSTLFLIYNSLSYHKVAMLLPIILATIAMSAAFFLAFRKYTEFQMEITAVFTVLILLYILNVFYFKEQLFDSMQYHNFFVEKYKGGQASVCLKNTLSIAMILLFNGINVLHVILVVAEYLLLISTEELSWSAGNLYYQVDKSGWKYAALVFQWYLTSQIIFQLFSLVSIQIGYRINLGQKLTCNSLSSHNILLAVQFSLILTLAAIPIKLVQFLKPQGVIVREQEGEKCCHWVTKCCYCCCGGILNLFHKFSFNPFLVNTIDKSEYGLIQSLHAVQHIYHKKYPHQDRCSQWLYRLSNYIIISLASVMVLNWLSESSEGVLGWQMVWLYVIGVIISNEVSRLNINFWSQCIEVSQFIEISHELNTQ